MIIYGTTAFATIVNTTVPKLLPVFENVVLVIHLAAFVGIIVPLVYFAPHRNTAEVFSAFETKGGYEGRGLSFMIGSSGMFFAFVGERRFQSFPPHQSWLIDVVRR